MLNILQELTIAMENRQPLALATIIDVQGRRQRELVSSFLYGLMAKRQEMWAGENLRDASAMRRKRPLWIRARTIHYSLREEGKNAIGMLCGGEVTVFIEPYMIKPILLVVGGGHIGQPLAEIGRIVGYDVQVVDVDPERADQPLLYSSTIAADTYVVIITEDHVTDERALRDALTTPAAYIGVIGSKRKIGKIMEHLQTDGFTDNQLARVRAPLVWIWGDGSRSRLPWPSWLK